jgi:hypothetical protein
VDGKPSHPGPNCELPRPGGLGAGAGGEAECDLGRDSGAYPGISSRPDPPRSVSAFLDTNVLIRHLTGDPRLWQLGRPRSSETNRLGWPVTPDGERPHARVDEQTHQSAEGSLWSRDLSAL